MVNPNAEPRVRRCTECGHVWLAGDPSAGRQPMTCPNDCNAAVLEQVPSTLHNEPKESSMNMLAIDVPIENLSDVLEDLDHSCGALRRVRDTLTNEEGWDHDRHRMIKAVIDQGLLLASVIRHMEHLIVQGHRYEFAQRGVVPSEITAA